MQRADSMDLPELSHRFTSWVAGKDRAVTAATLRSGRIVWRVDGIGDFAIDLEENTGIYRLHEYASAFSQDVLQEVLLGPFAVLMLAAQGCFCLHASGVELDGKSMLFLGDSGAGKSTLARNLMATGLMRTADDLSPVQRNDGFQHLPGFPQLKVDEALQYSLNEPEALDIGGLYFLEKDDGISMPVAEKAANAWAFEQLVRQTMSVKLFSADLLGEHLRLTSELVERVPCWRVSYPHRDDSIAWMADFLQNAGQ